MNKLTDEEAMDQIHSLMDGEEWDADTLDGIAEIVQKTGRAIGDCNELEEL